MTKIEAYRYLINQDRDISWIANVFFTSGGPNSAKRLKAMAKLLKQGREIGLLPFKMPYEVLVLDGKTITPAQLCEEASK